MLATIPVYVGQSCDFHRPQYLPTSANTGNCIGHNTCIYMSATIPVYVGQSCDLHQPQHLPTSATTSVYVGQHWDLRWPQHLYTLVRAVACIGYTVHGQGQALLARPDPMRARVGQEFWRAGPALIGSRARDLTLARPGLTRPDPV